MASIYRMYRLDADGRFMSVEVLDVVNDGEALMRARDKRDGSAIELWDRGRLIARLGPEPHSFI